MNEMRKLMEAIESIEESPSSEQWEIAINNLISEGEVNFAGEQCWEWVKGELHGMLDFQPESIEEDDDPCWDNYQMVGMKKKDGKEVPNCVPEGVEEYTIEEAEEVYGPLGEELNEAEYQGRKVELNKPMQGDVKKFKVYVKNPKGNVVKVNFGEKGAKIKKNNPERRKSFRARHNCDNPGPKHKARYWSCRKW
jgi:hypothetical protein